MSIAAISWALKLDISRSSEKFVLVCMCNYADENGYCYPSIAALSADTAQDRKTVIANIKALNANGLIRDSGRRVGATGQVIVYQIIGGSNGAENGTIEESQKRNSSENGTVPIFQPNSTVFPIKQSQKRDTDPSGNRQGTTIVLHDSLPREAWEEWSAHRREKRWSMSPRALKPQLKLLAKYDTATQIEIIETSMQAGWQGLFHPKGRPQTPKKGPYENAI